MDTRLETAEDLTLSRAAADTNAASLSRRRFLGLAGGVGVLGALAAVAGPRLWETSAEATTLRSADARTLVLVTLFGGNDGLNTVIPFEDPRYAAARGSLALPAATVLPLADGFGLHPALPGLKKLWDAHQLAVVHGVGFADPNYSHFESMAIWQSGITGAGASTGWIGRWLDASKATPLSALAIGPTLPLALVGQRVQGAAIPAGALVLPGSPDQQRAYAAMGATFAAEPGLLAEVATSGTDLLDVESRLGPLLSASATGAPAASGPAAKGGDLATQLSVVANLILAGAPSQVYGVELGSFDTHSDQQPTQTRLLGELDTAVSSFVSALASSPRGRQTVVVVFTEFGRRVAVNGSGGTDHGWANPVLVAGAPVRGGFFGSPPDLSKLSEGNLIYTTDFRSVYATMMERVLGVDSKDFLDGSFPILPLV